MADVVGATFSSGAAMATPNQHDNHDDIFSRKISPVKPHTIDAAQARSQLRKIADDEVIIVTSIRSTPAISLPGFLSLVAGFLLFKGSVIAWLGADLYGASINVLQHGSIFDQVAAFIMAPDGLSLSLASLFQMVLT